MGYRFPHPLQPGDTLRVVAPSGALREPESLHAGVAIWQERGFAIRLDGSVEAQQGYLAGSDAQRREALLGACRDPTCRGILYARGGYGSARLLESPLPPPPRKWSIGFSDATSLLWQWAQLGVVSLHGPLITTLASEPAWSIQRLFDCAAGRTPQPLQGDGWGGGRARGPLLPANLSVATHLLGTPLLPALQGAILAWEDVGEAPYRLDRLLTQWRLSGALQAVSGIALGRFSRCEPPPDRPSGDARAVLRDRLGDLGVPVVADLPFGHHGPNATLPVGPTVCLDGEAGVLHWEPW